MTKVPRAILGKVPSATSRAYFPLLVQTASPSSCRASLIGLTSRLRGASSNVNTAASGLADTAAPDPAGMGGEPPTLLV